MNKNEHGNTTLLTDVSELTETFRQIIREELSAKNEQEKADRMLSPEETCKLFSPAISLPTLAKYAKKGLLKKYYLGGRTWYRYGETIESIQNIKRYQK